jgi:hypothetical protein
MQTLEQSVQPTSLRGWIVKSLEQRELLSGLAKTLLRQDKMFVNQKDETEYWDYKEDIDLGNPNKIAQLSKWVLAFHNANGGVIIVGVTDNFKVVGIHENKILDTVRLRDKLKKYTGSNIPLFQGRIETHDYTQSKKVLWLIFIPKRSNVPVAIAENGPLGNGIKPTIQKGQYYIRVNDESKLCVSPNDFERLFSGVSFRHLSAYTYEIDEPYYRLLTPHQSQFIGRRSLLDELKKALDSRSYIISLDGVGGIGKSALAIEMVQQLYKAKTYDFIISLSAKNRVWVKHSEARQANFSGHTELLTEIANVLEIPTANRDISTVKNDVITLMKGLKGLLLIDNIEEIDDTAVFEFLKNEVPEPVKIIVTSRVSRDLGARTISVPGMTEDEAHTLLQQELERAGYTGYINELEDAKEIVKAAGYLPLAIKWAASLAASAQSLHHLSTQLRTRDTTRKEFLDFCFATMYDELSETARNVALLCPYLLNDWNTLALSITLDKPVNQIERAVAELEDRGILIASRDESFSMLPLTMDFLSDKWHEKKTIREEIINRITDSFTSDTHKGNLFNWPSGDRIKALKKKTRELESQKRFEEALRAIRLAIKWETDDNKRQALKLMEGKIVFETGDRHEGLVQMQNAIKQVKGEDGLDDEVMFLAQALLSHGKNQEQNEALEMVIRHIDNSTIVSQNLISEFCDLALRQRNYTVLSRLMECINESRYAYWLSKEVWSHLDDWQNIYYFGEPIVRILNLASQSNEATTLEKFEFSQKAGEIRQRFNSKPSP